MERLGFKELVHAAICRGMSTRSYTALFIALLLPFQGCGTLGGNPETDQNKDNNKWQLDFGEQNTSVTRLSMCLAGIAILADIDGPPQILELLLVGRTHIDLQYNELADIGVYEFSPGSYKQFGFILYSGCDEISSSMEFDNQYGSHSTNEGMILVFDAAEGPIVIDSDATSPIQFNFGNFLVAADGVTSGANIRTELQATAGTVTQAVAF